jgi:hypothetical protein
MANSALKKGFLSGIAYLTNIYEYVTGQGVNIDGWTVKDGGAGVITGGTNTFNIANGTASLDVAAGAAVNIDNDLAVTADVTLDHGLPNRNAIINGGFTVNQRVYVSAATLATTVYGHDRWKAGSGGGDYSFTQLAGPTTITIAANKTLIQVVEDKNVYGGSYVLSWTGTCQARYAINSATPAGAYAASPIVISGQTAGTTMSVEFGNGASSGTLGLVQLEISSVATPFEQRPFAQELALCMRYYEKSCDDSLAVGVNDGYGEVSSPGVLANSSTAIVGITYRVPKRTTPTVRIMANDGAAGAGTLNEIRNMNSGGLYTISGIYVTKNTGFKYIGMTDTVTVGNAFEFNWDATAEL